MKAAGGCDAIVKTHEALYRVAVTSYISFGGESLKPILLYDGTRNNFTDWISSRGVHVEFVSASWAPGGCTQGAYLRIDAPVIVKRLFTTDGTLQDSSVVSAIMLYTDVDVFFYRPVCLPCLLSQALRNDEVISFGAEHNRAGGSENSGVMLIDVEKFVGIRQDLITFGKLRNFNFPAHDQGLLVEYFSGKRVRRLGNEWNFKVYWGPALNISLVHFHGPKPGVGLECIADRRNTAQLWVHYSSIRTAV
jgi:hypothetical protein